MKNYLPKKKKEKRKIFDIKYMISQNATQYKYSIHILLKSEIIVKK
jgi:hypothetical protein